MLRLLRPSRPRVSALPRRRALTLEQLETRDCPSMTLSVTPEGGDMVLLTGQVSTSTVPSATVSFGGPVSGSVATDAQGDFSYTAPAASLGTVTAKAVDDTGATVGSAKAPLMVAVPTVNVSVAWGAEHQIVVSGHVTAADPQNCTVCLGGVVNVTATPDAQGNFSIPLNATALGTITAQAVDLWTQSSLPTAADLTTPAPGVTLAVASNGTHEVTLTGHVTGQDPQSTVVHFTGAVTGTTTPDASGNFTYTATATAIGTIAASAVDYWAQASDDADVILTGSDLGISSDSPQITDFHAVHINGRTWTFEGSVSASDLSGLSITFGGLTSVAGQTVTVGDDGSFSITVDMGDGENGSVTASLFDANGSDVSDASDEVRGN